MLERFGYQVVGKTTSTEALTLFEQQPDAFDVVITDMAKADLAKTVRSVLDKT